MQFIELSPDIIVNMDTVSDIGVFRKGNVIETYRVFLTRSSEQDNEPASFTIKTENASRLLRFLADQNIHIS